MADGMDPRFQSALDRLIAASNGRLFIKSGYRSPQKQAGMFDEAVQKYGSEAAARKWVAPAPGQIPGAKGSNHVHGVAADLGGDLEWAHAHAAEFGLVFPMDWEYWHIEPVWARDQADHSAYTDGSDYGGVNPKDDTSVNLERTVASFVDSLAGPQALGALSPEAEAALAGPGAPGQAETTSETVASGAPGSGASGDGGGTTKGNVTPEQVYQALRAAGVPETQAAALTAIAGRESGFNTQAYNGNRATGDDSHGLFQINLLNGGWGPTLQAHGVDPNTLNTLEGSARAAKVLLDASGGKLTPWGGYKNMPWYHGGVNLDVGVGASGGKVTRKMLESVS